MFFKIKGYLNIAYKPRLVYVTVTLGKIETWLIILLHSTQSNLAN